MRNCRLPFLFLVLGACSSPGTSARLHVQYEEGWKLEQFAIEVEGKHGTSVVSSSVQLLFPDEWAGRLVKVELWGQKSGKHYAHGSTLLTVALGREVPGDIVMSRLPCGAWCTPGATSCAGNSVLSCVEQPDAEQCRVWGSPTACPAEAPFCSFGVCGKTCIDECAMGDKRCAGPGAVLLCGQGNGGCSQWLQPVACTDGETCSGGTCGKSCQDECAAGSVECMGQGTITCADLNGDGCQEWGPVVTCGAGTTCSSGKCSATCTDECKVGEMKCAGLSFKSCGHYGLDSCLHLSPGTSCLAGDACLEGMCTATGCQSAPKVCGQPPASSCVNGNTLRVYDAQGACGGGACSYPAHDVACPNCPSCDACQGVVCNTPPNGCFAATGTCTNGSCSYGYANGVGCSDGNACTVGDVCNNGVCSGTAMACSTPPPATCMSATALRTYSKPGSCSAGACTYPFADMTCVYGCANGACALCTGAACPGVVGETVSANGGHTCGVKTDGTLSCWGSNDYGEATPPTGTFSSVSAGVYHTCGVKSDGTLSCWGNNAKGEATPPAGFFSSVSAGQSYTCGVKTNGTVACWGLNLSSQAAAPAGTFSSVSSGGAQTCGVKSDGTVACWGFNTSGQATPPPGLFSSVSAGYYHTCGVRTGGTLACWGDNAQGEATPPTGLFSSVSAGYSFTCGVKTNGTVTCWGDNSNGEGTPPTDLFSSVSAGFTHVCGVKTDGTVACWGSNANGERIPPAGTFKH